MKKIVKFLLPFLALNSALIFTGCDNGRLVDPSDKVYLSYGDMNAAGVVESISSADISYKITKEKENLLLCVSADNCSCYRDFYNQVLKQYITDNHLICYHKSYSEFKDYMSGLDINFISGHTTLAIIENGKAKHSIIYEENEKQTTDYDQFSALMGDLINMPKVYFVNEDNVKAMKSSNKNEVIYYERNKCGDCTFLNPTLLKDYVDSHHNMNNLYILDCQDWVGKEDYQDKKDEYGLSEANNPVYGYARGSFPYFSYIENGEYKSGCSVFNDSVNLVDDKIIVTTSYYNEDRLNDLTYLDGLTGVRLNLEGLEISEGNYTYDSDYDYYSWNKENSMNYYKPLLYAFLNYYLPKVSYSF